MCGQANIVRFIKMNRLRWLGQMERMADHRVPKRLFEFQPDGRMRAGRPQARWSDSVSGDLRVVVGCWRRIGSNGERC